MSEASKKPSDCWALPGASAKEPLAPWQEKVWAGQGRSRRWQEERDTPLLLLHGRKRQVKLVAPYLHSIAPVQKIFCNQRTSSSQEKGGTSPLPLPSLLHNRKWQDKLA